MPLFKGALSKEGKGVEKGESERKRASALFFELYTRKFWEIIKVSFMFLVASIPALLVMMFVSGQISVQITNVLKEYLDAAIKMEGVNDHGVLTAYVSIADVIIRIFIALLLTALWGTGPASAGYAYIFRCYAREEHAFTWSEFWEQTFKNFKQTIWIFVIDMLAFVLLVNAFFFYVSQGGAFGIMKYVIMCFFMVYTMMHFYIYPILINFKVKLGEAFKNSLLLSIIALPVNFLLLAGVLAIHFVMPYLGMTLPSLTASLGYWTIYIGMALFILQGLSGFLVAFVTNRVMKKYVLDMEKTEDKKELY
ncbi:MAG: DUF624 domain-containing protein [Clostridia bacterium]|nr:DUF624 domain-containing protein [Clostridia bacterium]